MTASSGLDLTTAQRTLDSQPFSRLLGARVTAFGEGVATLEIDVRAELHQQNGFLHGGVLSYAADNALTFAGGTRASTPQVQISSTPGAAVSPSRWARACARAGSASVRIKDPTSRCLLSVWA
ncbi:hypothetical protein SHIRM173S_00414 [Streptomyces hirsutus]